MTGVFLCVYFFCMFYETILGTMGIVQKGIFDWYRNYRCVNKK